MFTRLAQFALAALALTISNHANAAPLAYGTYYDETVAVACVSSVTSCRANFSQIPADKLLMIQKINCAISTLQPTALASLLISATFGGASLARYLPMALPPPPQLINSIYFISFREDTHYLVGQGRFPYVQGATQTPTTWSINCSIIGDLVTPIQ